MFYSYNMEFTSSYLWIAFLKSELEISSMQKRPVQNTHIFIRKFLPIRKIVFYLSKWVLPTFKMTRNSIWRPKSKLTKELAHESVKMWMVSHISFLDNFGKLNTVLTLFLIPLCHWVQSSKKCCFSTFWSITTATLPPPLPSLLPNYFVNSLPSVLNSLSF